MVITKADVKQAVIKLHSSGKSCPNEYVRINKCKSQEELNATFTAMVNQISDSIFDWFEHAGLPRKESWEKATYKAMGMRGDITAELMINALKEVRSEDAIESLAKGQEDKKAKPLEFSALDSDDKLCNKMLWSFTSKFRKTGESFGDYKPSVNEIECELDRLGLPISKGGLRRVVVEAGLIQRKYNARHNKTERVTHNGEPRDIPIRVLTVHKGVPILFHCMPKEFVDSLSDDDIRNIYLRLL